MLTALVLIGLAVSPLRAIEGIDVALARGGVAPLPMSWLEDPELTVHPPTYLHKPDSHYRGYRKVVANRGASIELRGTIKHAGRTLVLADDYHEVPFVDDGKGGAVARWSVAVSGFLRVRARFGDVVIEEPDGFSLTAVLDEVPTVELDGAPRTVELEKEGHGRIPLRYDAWDDHGLTDVHLVLRVGEKEERRVLAKLDAQPKHDRGGYTLRTDDPFVRKARTPIAVRIEARDNDPITGPKWGRSLEITLVPPIIGGAEARRAVALRKVRDTLVDTLALALEGTADAKGAASVEKAFSGAQKECDEFLTADHDGLGVPWRVALVVRGRLRKVDEAIATEKKAPGEVAHKRTIAAIEALTLRLDDALRALQNRDSKTISKLVAEVAWDGALAASALERDPVALAKAATPRLEVDLKALAGAGTSLRTLGGLGDDLGEIVENDLRRVATARQAKNLHHAYLALADLAARMREPYPSFSGGGGDGGGKGGDTAQGPPGDDESMEESEGEKQAGSQQGKLEELVKEHGESIGKVEDLLRAAEDPKQIEGLLEEAKRRAKLLRESVSGLPKAGGLKKDLTSAEASVREKVEAMAGALEKLQLGDAKERGTSGRKAIDEARDKSWMKPGAEQRLDDIETEVTTQLTWIEKLLAQIRKAAAEKAKEGVKGVAPREKGLSEKADQLGDDAEKKSPLPDDVKGLLEQAGKKMKEAAERLAEGDSDKALEAQKEAQRLLEKASQKSKNVDHEQGQGDEGNKSFDPHEKVEIGDGKDFKGPEAFRKRALTGLGSGATSPKLKDAVKRYTEGLVQ